MGLVSLSLLCGIKSLALLLSICLNAGTGNRFLQARLYCTSPKMASPDIVHSVKDCVPWPNACHSNQFWSIQQSTIALTLNRPVALTLYRPVLGSCVQLVFCLLKSSCNVVQRHSDWSPVYRETLNTHNWSLPKHPKVQIIGGLSLQLREAWRPQSVSAGIAYWFLLSHWHQAQEFVWIPVQEVVHRLRNLHVTRNSWQQHFKMMQSSANVQSYDKADNARLSKNSAQCGLYSKLILQDCSGHMAIPESSDAAYQMMRKRVIWDCTDLPCTQGSDAWISDWCCWLAWAALQMAPLKQ